MGSICNVYNKKNWKIVQECISKTKKEIVYQVKIGEWDDYCTYGDLKVWMFKVIYDKIMNEEYNVISQPYSECPILIKDKFNKIIDLLI